MIFKKAKKNDEIFTVDLTTISSIFAAFIIKFVKIPNSFFLATNDKFLSSVQFSKSISWMKCPDWISWAKYFWLENDYEKVWTWINASMLLFFTQ